MALAGLLVGVGTANIDSSSCACQRACIGDFPSPKTKGLSPVYYYNSLEGCVQLSPGCSLSSSECSYSSKAGCQLSCVTKASKACTNTQSGCCPDGTVKTEGGSCSKLIPLDRYLFVTSNIAVSFNGVFPCVSTCRRRYISG